MFDHLKEWLSGGEENRMVFLALIVVVLFVIDCFVLWLN